MHAKQPIKKEATLTSLAKSVDDLARITKRGFDEVNKRFEKIDKRLKIIDMRLDHLDARLAMLEHDVVESKNLTSSEPFFSLCSQ